MTLNNEKQKVNDQLGNPIIIGIAVIWKVTNTAKAVFNVDNYQEFLSIQCDSALRNIVRLYPYDVSERGDEKSLRGSSQEIAENLKKEIQQRVEIAGLTVMEARITHLAYAPEIAAVMLQRQQASAIIDARKMIVEGAVSMVDMALSKLGEENIVQLNREAAREIARQLRLRNLSGMILIDFIDMKKADHEEEILQCLKEAVRADSTGVTVVDMTKLGIVECTRKKTSRPLYEQVRE